MPYAKRTVLKGFPKCETFQTREQIDTYLSDERIACLLCGHRYRILDTHLQNVHEMTGDDYREKYGLPYCRGLCGASFSERRSELAKALYADNIERQSAALIKARAVQEVNGNPQRGKPTFWKMEMSGSSSPVSKLEEKDIPLIRADRRSLAAIGKDYGVTLNNIYAIKKGKTWKYIGATDYAVTK